MAETYTKSQEINNATSTSNTRFLPLHFYFCDHEMFLPLIALQYHQIELRIEFPDASQAADVKLYGNYVYLDTEERTFFVDNSHEFIITQVQKQTYDTSDNLDISFFNHPVKSLYFGHPVQSSTLSDDKFTFDTADIYLNSIPLVENMSPLYYHSIQNYKHSKFGINKFDEPKTAPSIPDTTCSISAKMRRVTHPPGRVTLAVSMMRKLHSEMSREVPSERVKKLPYTP